MPQVCLRSSGCASVASPTPPLTVHWAQAGVLATAPNGPSREEWGSLRRHIQNCADRLAALGPTNARANADGQQILARKNQVENRVTECRQEVETCAAHLKEEKEAVRAAFHEALARVKKRFTTYSVSYTHLTLPTNREV